MRIVVISDTHIPRRATRLPKELYAEIEKADALIHAGDFTSLALYEQLKGLIPTYGVRGNMDEPEVCEVLPRTRVEQLGGVTIGVAHGSGSPFGLRKRVKALFGDDLPRLLVYGHSHRAALKEENEVIYLNPGSPTDTIFATRQSYALVEIEEGQVRPTLVYL